MRTGFPACTTIVSGVYPPFTSTRTSCTPLTPAAAVSAVPRDSRKYQSTHAAAAAPAAVTAIWMVDIRPASPRADPVRFDPHAIERTPHEDQGHEQESGREQAAEHGAALGPERHGQLDGEEPEQRRELDDRI